MAEGRVGRRGSEWGLGSFLLRGPIFLLSMQRIALYSQLGLDLVYIKEIEHLFCAGLFFSSFASQRVLGKSINKDLALFSLCGWDFGVGNPSVTGLALTVGARLSASVQWIGSGAWVIMLGTWRSRNQQEDPWILAFCGGWVR